MRNQAIFLSVIALYAFVLAPLATVWAQEVTIDGGDITAPVIQHDPQAETANAGRPLEIIAIISDDQEVSEATLFYRVQGNREYFSINMTLKEAKSYSATIPQDEVIEPGLEYFIQSTDEAGNSILRGFSFEPLVILVSPYIPDFGTQEELVSEDYNTDDLVLKSEFGKTTPWYKKWWVWTIASGVVLATAAAAGSGGGSGGGGGQEPPTTGTAVIDGAIP